MPAGYTDQAQPIDDGAGRQYKIYVGQEEDAWLEDDDNLRKWENNELTTSNRRILLAHWYCAAHKRVVESRAIRKYFEHTGALLTADGTDDDLIKLEGMPKGHKFTWVDDDDAQPFEPTPSTAVPDPPDVGPLRESEGEGVSAEASNYVEDDSDGDDMATTRTRTMHRPPRAPPRPASPLPPRPLSRLRLSHPRRPSRSS